MRRNIYFLLFYTLLLGCSVELPKSSPALDFFLDREGTTTGTIFLNFLAEPGKDYLISFETDDTSLSFVAPNGESAKITGITQIPIATNVKGVHNFKFTVFSMDGTALASDDFEFVYKFDFVDFPAISLSKKASRDTNVSIQVSAARKENVDQLWVEGDVHSLLANQWHTIDILDKVDVVLTPGAGLKNLRVKVRNKNGAESPFTDLSIMVDTTNPDSCGVELATDKIGSGYVNARFTGNDNSGMKYSVSGDVTASISDVEFTSGDDFWIPVATGDGTKSLTFSIGDYANNFCLVETKQLTFETGHNPIGVELVGSPIYTYTRDHTINLRLDAFKKEDYQIYISGGVVNSAETHSWIPYQDNMNITLELFRGTRVVYFKILHKGVESQNVYDYVYLNPQLTLTPGATYKVHAPNIVDTDTLTITGCVETYVNVPFQQSYDCTPAAANVSATMFFDNGTNLTLTEAF